MPEYLTVLAQTHIHLEARSSFTLTEVVPLHVYSVTSNLFTYFAGVGRVFLI